MSINSGGEKIYPEEVEGALKIAPDVFDVLVVGVPDKRWGERVCRVAAAAARPASPSSKELREHCRSRIAGYKIPRELLLVAEVPRLVERETRLSLGQGTGASDEPAEPGGEQACDPEWPLTTTVNRVRSGLKADARRCRMVMSR